MKCWDHKEYILLICVANKQYDFYLILALDTNSSSIFFTFYKTLIILITYCYTYAFIETLDLSDNETVWAVMKNRKSHYTAFELFEANILIFKGSNFQISLGYLSILDMVTVNKYAFSHFFAICQTKILSNGLEISNRREGIFVWN